MVVPMLGLFAVGERGRILLVALGDLVRAGGNVVEEAAHRGKAEEAEAGALGAASAGRVGGGPRARPWRGWGLT